MNIDIKYRWIARDKDGDLYAYEEKPVKSAVDGTWFESEEHALGGVFIADYEGGCSSIKWEDEEPYDRLANKDKWVLNETGKDTWSADETFNSRLEAVITGVELLNRFNSNPSNNENIIEISDVMGIHTYGEKSVTSFDVGQIFPYDKFNGVDELLELVADNAYQECGDVAEDYLDDVKEEHKQELDELITGWFKKHNHLPNFYMIENVSTIKLSDFDESNFEEV